MTDFNYKYDYEFIVGRHDQITRSAKNFDSGEEITDDFLTETIDALSIKGLQLIADIKYSKKAENSTKDAAKFVIYNLSNATKNKIKENDYVHFKAGYKNNPNLPLIYVGRILKVVTRRSGVDMLTHIYCAMTTSLLEEAIVYGEAEKGDTYDSVMQKLVTVVKNTGMPVGDYDNYSIDSYNSQKTFENGYSYEGTLFEKLRELAQIMDYKVFMSIGKMYIRPRETLFGYPVNYQLITLTPDDVKNVPNEIKDTVGKTADDISSNKGVEIVTYLDGRITQDKVIRLEGFDEELVSITNGDYVVEVIKHDLDFEGGKWDTILTLKAVSPVEGET